MSEPTLSDGEYEPICLSTTWGNLGNKFSGGELSLLGINMRSLAGKFSELVGHLNIVKNKFSFIVLCETWLNEGTDVACDLDGYRSFSLYRDARTGGGIKIYVDCSINAYVVEDLTSSDGACESLFIKCRVSGVGDFFVGGIYRPPNKPINQFFDRLDSIFVFLNLSRCIMAGDFNLDVLDRDNTHVKNYIDLFNQHGFTNEINLPTYCSPITNSDTSSLDHVWQNFNISRKSFVIRPNLSDHYATGIIYSKIIKHGSKRLKFRDFSNNNVLKFQNSLQREFSSFSPPSEQVNPYASYLVKFLSKLLNRYFPIKTKTISNKRIKSPWITPAILRCISKKHRWFRLFRDGIITARSYKSYTGELRRLLRTAEEEYYVRKFTSLNGDMKRNWNILNGLLGRNVEKSFDHLIINGSVISDPQIIANEFGRYFISHPMNIHDNIPTSTSDYISNIPMNPNSMVMREATVSEVSVIVSNLRKNGGLDDISRRFLYLCGNYVPVYLCKLFNLCINQSVFPDVFKVAKITPIHKKGPRNLVSNFRPISVLTNFSKIFESLLYNRLQSFFQANEILSRNQFGYRKNLSTELAVFDLLFKVLPAIADKKYCLCIFLDYSACFDTLSREILFKKLYRYGVRGLSLNLFRSYFDNRKQSVAFNCSSSTESEQKLGVIQGSKTGPLFFDIYSGDFDFLCTDDENILYADDTCLVYVGDDLSALELRANQKLASVQEWCNSNKLSLNPAKSEFMLITNRTVPVQPSLFIGSNPVKRTDSFKYLGVRIDKTLKFHSHILAVKSNLSRMCGVTFRLGKYLNLRAAKNMYFACIYSTFSYCICSWGGALVTTHRGDRLIGLQAKIVKNLFEKFYSGDACLFKACRILKLVDVYKFRVCIYMYRVLILNELPTLRENLELEFPQHEYNTRSNTLLITPFPRVEVVRMSYSYQFVRIWNEIPDFLKAADTLRKFKNNLMSRILDSY